MDKRQHREKRHNRVRAKVRGTKETPRASVFRSNKHIFVQIIDDVSGKTLASSKVKLDTPTPKGRGSDRSVGEKSEIKGNKTEKASVIGEALAKKAQETGISKIVFDRGGYKYHGRVKALAEGLRRGGLKF